VSAPTSFDTSAALRSLGVNRGADIPSINLGELDQTIIIADLSESFAQQRFEARGFGTGLRSGIAGEFSVVQLNVNSPGGAVIERIDINPDDVAGGRSVGLNVGDRQTLNNAVPGVIAQVGGSPLTSTLEGGSITPTITPLATIIVLGGQKTYDPFGWFIPSGSSFFVQTANGNIGMFITFQCRLKQSCWISRS